MCFSRLKTRKKMLIQRFYISVSVVFFCNPCSSLRGCPRGHLSAAEHLLKIYYDFIFSPEIKSLPPFPSLHITDCHGAPLGDRLRPSPLVGKVVGPRDSELRPGPLAPCCSWPATDHIPSSSEKMGQPQSLDLCFLKTDTQCRKLPSCFPGAGNSSASKQPFQISP